MAFMLEAVRPIRRDSLRRRRRECTSCSAHGFTAGICPVCSRGRMVPLTPAEYEPEHSLHLAHR